jgi:hypothetical protein
MVYGVVKQLAVVAGVIGAALLLHHLTGQIRVGWAPAWTLITGIGLPIVSLLFWMIADIGSRLAADRGNHDHAA